LKKRINSALADYRKGNKCSCGNDIWSLNALHINQEEVEKEKTRLHNKSYMYCQFQRVNQPQFSVATPPIRPSVSRLIGLKKKI
jgi:hypothetical protein